jgi:GT2 family glycosyltransferase
MTIQSTRRGQPARVSIAIVMPAHNRAAEIGEALASVRNQHGGLTAIDAIYVADDCSSDGTAAAAAAAWGEAAPPLRVLQPASNLGQFGNVNAALAGLIAAHDWLLFLHDDDTARFDWLARMTDRIQACAPTVATVCSSWDVLYDRSIAEIGEDDPVREVELVASSDAAVRSTLLRGCWWHFSGAAIRVEALRRVGLFDEELPQCADWDWLLRCLADGWSVEYIPRALIRYRQHPRSISSQSFRTHRDLTEHLILLHRYGRFLERSDIWTIHRRLGSYAGRRAARAVLQVRPAGVWRAARTGVGIARSCARMLSEAAAQGAGRFLEGGKA